MDSVAFWDAFDRDPRTPDHAHLRASDQERDVVLDLLGTAYAEGRLTRDEFDERSADVAAARTLGELPPIVEDLVAAVPATPSRTDLHAEAVRRYHADRLEALTYLGPAVICWVIWVWLLAADRGTPFPWPIFVTMGTAMPAIRLWINPEDHIASRQRRLEKKLAAGQPLELERDDHELRRQLHHDRHRERWERQRERNWERRRR